VSWEDDPWRRYERERERRMWDPWYRYEYEMERMREDQWYRQVHRMERGLRIYQYADPVYVEEKEEGLGTRTNDYLNPDYRIHMDALRKRRRELDFDPFIW